MTTTLPTCSPNRPDYSRLSKNMKSTIEVLEATWADAEDLGDMEIAWACCLNAGTIYALRNRGFEILQRKTYYGTEYRMPDPHISGLGW